MYQSEAVPDRISQQTSELLNFVNVILINAHKKAGFFAPGYENVFR
ncbi:Uncharacterized protein dnm_063870 [Desulfonema magnum]|uniref:Uncharacterized protein n=1 Tax=Desulfonema magnum TaxID=45655 RepID=A0A975GQR9_9BACT|nr:Uncharacterized protein dnm_063870 [Desulfonema magnum]